MNKEYLAYLARQMMIELSPEECEQLLKDFDIIEQQFALLDKIVTTAVEPMVYPNENETTYLREDVVSDVMERKELLSNAKLVKDGMLAVPKVAAR